MTPGEAVAEQATMRTDIMIKRKMTASLPYIFIEANPGHPGCFSARIPHGDIDFIKYTIIMANGVVLSLGSMHTPGGAWHFVWWSSHLLCLAPRTGKALL